MTYSIEGKLVTVKLRPDAVSVTEEVMAAPKTGIYGYARDSAGKPLPDITVTVRGKGRSVRTDKNGRFSIQAEPGDVLVFSSVSFVPNK